MENENELNEFERALVRVLEIGDVSVIPDLCEAFDDDAEQIEVMFGWDHAIESLYNNMEEGLSYIAKFVPQ